MGQKSYSRSRSTSLTPKCIEGQSQVIREVASQGNLACNLMHRARQNHIG